MSAYRTEWRTEPEDLQEMLKIHIRADRSLPVLSTIMGVLLAIGMVWFYFEQSALPVQVLVFILTGVGGFFAIYMALYLIALGSGKLVIRKNKQPLATTLLTIDQNGINGETRNSSYHIKWERVQKLEELSNYLLIQTKKQEKVLIPKRTFDNPEKVNEVMAFIRHAIQESHEG